MKKQRNIVRGFQLNLENKDSFQAPIVANVNMAVGNFLSDNAGFNGLPSKLQAAVVSSISQYCRLQHSGWVQEVFNAVRETARQNRVDLDKQHESLDVIAPKLDATMDKKIAEFMDEAVTVARDRVAYMLAQYNDPKNAAKFGLN